MRQFWRPPQASVPDACENLFPVHKLMLKNGVAPLKLFLGAELNRLSCIIHSPAITHARAESHAASPNLVRA